MYPPTVTQKVVKKKQKKRLQQVKKRRPKSLTLATPNFIFFTRYESKIQIESECLCMKLIPLPK